MGSPSGSTWRTKADTVNGYTREEIYCSRRSTKYFCALEQCTNYLKSPHYGGTSLKTPQCSATFLKTTVFLQCATLPETSAIFGTPN